MGMNLWVPIKSCKCRYRYAVYTVLVVLYFCVFEKNAISSEFRVVTLS